MHTGKWSEVLLMLWAHYYCKCAIVHGGGALVNESNLSGCSLEKVKVSKGLC
jgi:hypothetical protein